MDLRAALSAIFTIVSGLSLIFDYKKRAISLKKFLLIASAVCFLYFTVEPWYTENIGPNGLDGIQSSASKDSSSEKPTESPMGSSAGIVQEKPSSSTTYTPTPTPTPSPLPTLSAVRTAYGKARNEQVSGYRIYSASEGASLAIDAYYDRTSYINGEKTVTEGFNTDHDYDDFGYRLGFYYADDFLYYAEVRESYSENGQRKTLVRLYYWGDEIVACNDYLYGDGTFMQAGDSGFERIVKEFGYVYDFGVRRYFYE